MIVKVGNQSFDSRQVPVALVLDDQDLLQIGSIPFKQDKPQAPRSLYVRGPIDIDTRVLRSWLQEAVTEMPLPPTMRAFNPGRPLED